MGASTAKTNQNNSRIIKEKILVYGITGMLGSRIRQMLSSKFNIIAPTHKQLDLTNTKKVLEHLNGVKPDQIVYAAGLTKIDDAQKYPDSADLLNFKVIAAIAKEALKLKIPVHYISTDAVFDGTQKGHLYKESDKPNPLSVYGKSKLKGERIVLSCSKNNSVIRTIMVYSSNYAYKSDFVRLAYERLKNKKKIEGIEDQTLNPTFVDDLVYAISLILKNHAKGIYHVAAKDFTTNFGFLIKLAEVFKFDKSLITKVKFKDFFKNKIAPRTQYSVLDTAKFQKSFGEDSLKTIDESLEVFKKQISTKEELPS